MGSLLKSKKSTNFNFTGAIKLALKVTIFTDGTFRIAVFMAKGGYSHRFYVNVDEPWTSLPSQTPVYQKPFGAYWFKASDGYYVEMTDKIWYVKL